MANKFKNPITIVQGSQPSLLGQTVTATGSSTTTLVKTPGGSYLNPSSSLAHGYLMADMTNTLLVNLHDCTSWRIILKFKFNSLTTDQFNGLFGSGNYSPFIYKTPSHKISVDLYNNSRTAVSGGYVDYVISSNTWYYVAVRWENGLNIVSLYDEDGTLLGTGYSLACKDFYNTNYSQLYLGGSSNSSWVGRNLEMDISECCYEKDGIAVWGATNDKTQNMGVFFTDWNEFTEVEYIQSSGTQRMFTDITVESTDKISTRTAIVSNVSSNQCVFCARGLGTNTTTKTMFNIGGHWRADFNATSGNTYGNIVANQFYNLVFDDNKFYVDGTLVQTFTPATFTAGGYLALFASYNRTSTEYTESSWGNYSYAKQGAMEIKSQNGIIKHDLKPCYHTATGIAGMFDTVNNKFYMNAGTGEFTVPQDVNDYQEVEYIESTGTQYMDLGFVAKTDLRTIADIEFTQLGYQHLSSVWRSGAVLYGAYLDNSNKIAFRYNSNTRQSSITPSVNTRYKLEAVISSNSQKLYIDDEQVLSYSDSININTGANMYLMCSNDSSETIPYKPAFAKWYGFKAYIDGTLVRDLVPCYHKDTGVIGMFDTVNSKFYANQGTGTFIKGPDVVT